MSVEALLLILVWLVIIFVIGYILHWIVTTYFAEPLKTPILMIVGLVLLIAVILLLIRGVPPIALR